MAVIDFGELEANIKLIEEVFKTADLNLEEQQLVIKCVNSRLVSKLQQQKTKDLVNGFNFSDMIGRFGGGDK